MVQDRTCGAARVIMNVPFYFHHVTALYVYISAFCEATTEYSFIKLIWFEYQNKKIEMSGACSTYGVEGRFILVRRPDGSTWKTQT